MIKAVKLKKTNKNTIIGFSNDISKSLIIYAKDKQKLQELFREAGKHRIFVYKVFAILIFILIKDYLDDIKEIVIDEEYPGKSNIIKNYLFQEIIRINPNFSVENIVFKRIGKKSKAHYTAYGTAIKKRVADRVASSKNILKFIVK